jgi:RNA-directed DNA polymerase
MGSIQNLTLKPLENSLAQDYLTYLKLRRWAKRRCGNINAGHRLYWHSIGGDNWVFSTREEGANPLRLLKHREFECSSTDYVKVKGDKSPYDGDLVVRIEAARESGKLKDSPGKRSNASVHFLGA